MMMFTCTVCGTRQTKTFTKRAYQYGAVLIRCEGCHTVHLVADNLGWFEDEPTNVEKIMKSLGKEDQIKKMTVDVQTEQLLRKKIAETRLRSQKIREANNQQRENEGN